MKVPSVWGKKVKVLGGAQNNFWSMVFACIRSRTYITCNENNIDFAGGTKLSAAAVVTSIWRGKGRRYVRKPWDM